MNDLSASGLKRILLSDYGLQDFNDSEFGWAKEYEFRVAYSDGSDGMEAFLRLAYRAMPESFNAIKINASNDENYTLLALMSKIEAEAKV